MSKGVGFVACTHCYRHIPAFTADALSLNSEAGVWQRAHLTLSPGQGEILTSMLETGKRFLLEITL